MGHERTIRRIKFLIIGSDENVDAKGTGYVRMYKRVYGRVWVRAERARYGESNVRKS